MLFLEIANLDFNFLISCLSSFLLTLALFPSVSSDPNAENPAVLPFSLHLPFPYNASLSFLSFSPSLFPYLHRSAFWHTRISLFSSSSLPPLLLVENFPTIEKLQWAKKKLRRIIIRVSETQQTKNWLRGRLHWRELTIPTLKSLPYVPFALLLIIKRPVGRFFSSFLRLLRSFMLHLSIECPFAVICEA